MDALPPLKRLDLFLSAIADNSNPDISQADLFKIILEKTSFDALNGLIGIQNVIDKLIEDRFITRTRIESTAQHPTGQTYPVYKDSYSITFKGEVFNAQGGYVDEQFKEAFEKKVYRDTELKATANRKTVTALTWIIAVGTFVAALYYGIEVLKYFCVIHK